MWSVSGSLRTHDFTHCPFVIFYSAGRLYSSNNIFKVYVLHSTEKHRFFSVSTADKMKCFNMNSEASTLSAYYIVTKEKIQDLCKMAAAQIDH